MTTKTTRIAHKPAAKTQKGAAPASTKAPVARKVAPKSARPSGSKPTSATGRGGKTVAAVTPASAPGPAASKQARLIALLRSPKGGTIEIGRAHV